MSKKRKNKVYSAEFKINAIMDMREHRLSYRETAKKHGLVRQKETYGDYEVSWSYHPDNGLDAIFRIIK